MRHPPWRHIHVSVCCTCSILNVVHHRPWQSHLAAHRATMLTFILMLAKARQRLAEFLQAVLWRDHVLVALVLVLVTLRLLIFRLRLWLRLHLHLRMRMQLRLWLRLRFQLCIAARTRDMKISTSWGDVRLRRLCDVRQQITKARIIISRPLFGEHTTQGQPSPIVGARRTFAWGFR